MRLKWAVADTGPPMATGLAGQNRPNPLIQGDRMYTPHFWESENSWIRPKKL